MMTDYVKKHKSKCWDCANATGGCSWSEYGTYKPVEGWVAMPSTTKIGKDAYYETWDVWDCPEFVRDPPRKSLSDIQNVGKEKSWDTIPDTHWKSVE